MPRGGKTGRRCHPDAGFHGPCPDPDPGLVHHVEHVAETAIFLADQIAHRAALLAKIQRGGGVAPPPHLVKEPGQRHIVALP